MSYEFDSYKVSLGNTYFGDVSFIHPEDGNRDNWVLNELSGEVESRDQKFTPKLLTDLAVSYKFNSSIELTLGGNNIFNVYPDKHTHSANIDNGNFVYSRRVQQFGVNGSNFYMRAFLKL